MKTPLLALNLVGGEGREARSECAVHRRRGDRDRSAQAVGHDRGDGARRPSWAVAGLPPTSTASGRCASTSAGEQRVWAIEGCAGSGGHVAARLTRTGEDVVDVPSKLSARARVFTSGQGRKTDATDAHSVVLVGVRMTGPRAFVNDEQLGLLRVLVDRRRSLGEDHTRMVSQVHALLL